MRDGIHSYWVESLASLAFSGLIFEVLRGAGIVRHGLLDLCAD